MSLTRRHFAGLCAALGTLPMAPLASALGAPAFLSAYRDENGDYGVAALDDMGALLFTERLPGRGHDTVCAPNGQTAITFARRPGRFALAIDLKDRNIPYAFEAAPNRHFYGHGFFSPDGRLLYATENAYEDERGVIGIYDVEAGYQRIGEFDTHGIGPHEAILMADKRTIAVANGGILTHPDFPRWKLNLANMVPSLAYIDLETGDLQELVALPPSLHQLSIRHMAQAGDRSIWFGGQFEGTRAEIVPLIGRHRRGSEIELINLPDPALSRLNHYIASVKASADGERIAVTSSRGNMAYVLDAIDHRIIESIPLTDVSGCAPLGNHFCFTTGQGALRGTRDTQLDLSFDNHLTGLLGVA